MRKQISRSEMARQPSMRREVEADVTVKTRDVWSFTNVLFLYMMFPSLCRIPFTILSCKSIHTDIPPDLIADLRTGATRWFDRQYLRVDLEETCWEGRHLSFVLLLAVPGVIVYALGLPLIAFWLIWRAAKRGLLGTKKYVFRLGLLYSGYRPDRWWYEGVVTMRKLLIIVSAAFLHSDAMQLHLTLSVMISAYAVHHVLMPFVAGPGAKRPKIAKESSPETQTMLHRLERNSIFISMSVVWASTVFILYNESQGAACEELGCNVLVLTLVLVQALFMLHGLWLFVKFFLERNARHVGRLNELIVRAKRLSRGMSMKKREDALESRKNEMNKAAAQKGGDWKGRKKKVSDDRAEAMPPELILGADLSLAAMAAHQIGGGAGEPGDGGGSNAVTNPLSTGGAGTSEWKKFFDNATGDPYWFNAATGESKWTAEAQQEPSLKHERRRFTHHKTLEGISYFVPEFGTGEAVWELPEDAELANLGVG